MPRSPEEWYGLGGLLSHHINISMNRLLDFQSVFTWSELPNWLIALFTGIYVFITGRLWRIALRKRVPNVSIYHIYFGKTESGSKQGVFLILKNFSEDPALNVHLKWHLAVHERESIVASSNRIISSIYPSREIKKGFVIGHLNQWRNDHANFFVVVDIS
ncbi:MAG: hypothetical protein Q8919_04430, partial [Bacteroidota bacterium]|nr:hypothetical protein [Bacteroidota bacterium]